MLYILISLIFIFPIWIGFGKLWNNKNGLAITLSLGIFSIATLWTLLSFFIPLNLYTEIATSIIGFALFFILKGYKDIYLFIKNHVNWKFIILGLFIIGLGSSYPYILDHFGYYVPSIKWLTEVGLVKGISNLDLILGQMSVWHILQAGFSNFSDPFLRINTLLLIVYSIYIFEKKAWFQLCFIPILIAFSQSPSPDLPVIIFSIIIVNEILKRNTNIALLFGLSCFVSAIKPTAIWLPLFSFIYGVFLLKKNLKFIGIGAFIILLFIIKNIWTFGYPIFPMQLFELDVDWKANHDLLKNSSQLALEKTYDLQYSYQEIIHFSWQQKIINWFTLDGIKGKIHIIFVLSLMILGVFSFIKKEKIYRWLFLTILLKSALVLAFSAQYRFLLEVFFIIGLVILQPIFRRKISEVISSILGIIALSIFIFPFILQKAVPSFRLGAMIGKAEWKMLYQPLHYTYNQYDTFKIGNLTFHVSQNYPFSFDSPTPAISPSFLEDYLKIGIFPQYGENGFIWRKLTEEEKHQLSQIIKKINSK